MANNGRTPTTITGAGFEDSKGTAVFLEASDRLEPGEVGVYWFDLEEFERQGFDYATLRPVLETGHGNFYGERVTPSYAQSIRVHCERRSQGAS